MRSLIFSALRSEGESIYRELRPVYRGEAPVIDSPTSGQADHPTLAGGVEEQVRSAQLPGFQTWPEPESFLYYPPSKSARRELAAQTGHRNHIIAVTPWAEVTALSSIECSQMLTASLRIPS
jgi:hypothetical protein